MRLLLTGVVVCFGIGKGVVAGGKGGSFNGCVKTIVLVWHLWLMRC